MDATTFRAEIKRLAAEFKLDKHPYVQLVHTGKASRDQLKNYSIQHYEMTVRDADMFGAEGFLRMREIDPEGARDRAMNFAEQALGSTASRHRISNCYSNYGTAAWGCRARS